ncbi:MAG: hypothetical protein RL217_1812 [Pseudomonadota bacterium]|jgi:hypothetical protein
MAASTAVDLGEVIRFNLTFLSYFSMILYHHLALTRFPAQIMGSHSWS